MTESKRATVRLSSVQKELISDEMKRDKCGESDVIRRAIDQYFDRKNQIVWQKQATKKLDAIMTAVMELSDE